MLPAAGWIKRALQSDASLSSCLQIIGYIIFHRSCFAVVLCEDGEHDELFCSQSAVDRPSSQRSGPCDETYCHRESVGGVRFKHIICQHTHAVDTHTHTQILRPCTHLGVQGQRIIVSLCVRLARLRMGACALQTCLRAAGVCVRFCACTFCVLMALETARHMVSV